MTRVHYLQARPSNRLERIEREGGYRFTGKERDPDLEWICNAITESGLTSSQIQERVLKATDNHVFMSTTTIDNWLSGKVKKPQNRTITLVATALGYRRVWTKDE